MLVFPVEIILQTLGNTSLQNQNNIMRWKLSRETYTTQYRNNAIFPFDVTDFINIPIC